LKLAFEKPTSKTIFWDLFPFHYQYCPISLPLNNKVFVSSFCSALNVSFTLLPVSVYCSFLDGPGIESWWGRDFLHLSRLTLGPTPYTMGTGSFPGVKWPGRGIDHTPPSSAKVKERMGIYLCSPSGPS